MRILFLTHRVPFPPDKGDRIRSFHMLKELAGLGQVDLAYLTDEPAGRDVPAALLRACRRVEAIPVGRAWRWARAAWSLARGGSLTEGLFGSPAMRAVVDRWLAEVDYDAVVCFSSGVFPYVRGRGLESRLLVDLVDVDSQKWLDYAGRSRGPKSPLFRLEAGRVRALERAAGAARAVLLCTGPEAELYREICPGARIETVPNGVDLDFFRPSGEAAEVGGCVFVGQLDYRANVLGLEWFCHEAWPAIRARRPEATLRVVGRDPVASVRRLGGVPGVEVVGPVPDVRPYLASARLVVVPLTVARGVQNKVLEAMAMGRPVVASPQALEGLPLVPGHHALAAASPRDWAAKVDRLWDSPGERDALGRAARRYVEENHRWESCLGRLRGFVEPGGRRGDRAAGSPRDGAGVGAI